MNIGTRLFTLLKGRSVGTDAAGNIYYEERRPRPQRRIRRWVAYAGTPEASDVPPEWHAWLHYTTDAPLAETARRPWQTSYVPNLTGTAGRLSSARARLQGRASRRGHRRLRILEAPILMPAILMPAPLMPPS